MKLVDRWNECYEGEHRQVSPEEFKSLFCDNCMNASCSNSKGSGMTWVQRMATQADRLLNNPSFAHMQDPEFRAIRELNFQDMLHQELSIQISTQKGDWSVPSSMEVANEASKLITGKPMPQGFQAPEPEPVIEEVTPEPPKRKQISTWEVKGSGKKTYSVTLWDDQKWECECPYFLNKQQPCKHIKELEKSYGDIPIQEPQTPEPVLQENPKQEQPVVPRRPPPITSTPSINTSAPQGGYIIGGGNEKAPEPEIDPWAAPKEKPTNSVPVGGTFTFGSKK